MAHLHVTEIIPFPGVQLEPYRPVNLDAARTIVAELMHEVGAAYGGPAGREAITEILRTALDEYPRAALLVVRALSRRTGGDAKVSVLMAEHKLREALQPERRVFVAGREVGTVSLDVGGDFCGQYRTAAGPQFVWAQSAEDAARMIARRVVR